MDRHICKHGEKQLAAWDREKWSFLLLVGGTGPSAEPPKGTCQPEPACHWTCSPTLPSCLSPRSVHVGFTLKDPLPSFTNHSCSTTNPNRAARSPASRDGLQSWSTHTSLYFSPICFLSVTSVLCFLTLQMFPNTSCLVRCLRQTERCCWRQCFIAQFVHYFIAKLK